MGLSSYWDTTSDFGGSYRPGGQDFSKAFDPGFSSSWDKATSTAWNPDTSFSKSRSNSPYGWKDAAGLGLGALQSFIRSRGSSDGSGGIYFPGYGSKKDGSGVSASTDSGLFSPDGSFTSSGSGLSAFTPKKTFDPFVIPGQQGRKSVWGRLAGAALGIGASFIPGLGPGIAAAMPAIGSTLGEGADALFG